MRVQKLEKDVEQDWKRLGPGLITGAADDDPSGIATYSQTGAQFGFGQLWTALYQLPLILAVQEACARIGAVTGKGLSGVVREHYSKKLLAAVVLLVVIANTINIGADIGAIASASQLVIDLPFAFYAIASVALIVLLEIFISYKNYKKFLKFLALSLLAYPVTALIVHEPWRQIIAATVIPHLQFSFAFFFIVVGVFGTTITPYMFFWQASEEVEEEFVHRNLAKKGGAPHRLKKFLRSVRIDTAAGMIAAEVAQWFIIITTATVLFSHGITNITTAADAAQALEPLVHSFPNAGQLAKDIFAVGIIGLGLLAIPVLAGSTAYAIAEAFNWREGLYRKFNRAKGFYGVIVASMLVGLLMNFVGINPIRALVFAAVFNGVTAVPLLFMINRINANESILGEYKGGMLSQSVIWITFAIMGFGAIGMFTMLFTSSSHPTAAETATTTQPMPLAPNLIAYTDPASIFTFVYPINFSLAEVESGNSTSWAVLSTTTGMQLAKITVPKGFEPGTNFGDAWFSVGTSADPAAVAACLVGPSPNPNASSTQATIGGVPFTELTFGDAGAGNRYDTTSYRTVRGGQCYAIEYTIHYGVFENYPPGTIQKFDEVKVKSALDAVAQSFRFIK